MLDTSPLWSQVSGALDVGSGDLRGWAVAWARVAPSIALVPAFGLRAVPVPVRAVIGLMLVASCAPALRPVAAGGTAWQMQLLEQSLRGLPVALAAASALWAATMAGGLMDDLRHVQDRTMLPIVEPGATPMGALLGLFAAIAFLFTGGAARVAAALAQPDLQLYAPLERSTHTIIAGIELAIAVATPVVVAAVVVEVAAALMTRAAEAVTLPAVIAPLRSVVLLGVVAVMLDRMLELLALAVRTMP